MTLPRSVEEAWTVIQGAPESLEAAGLALDREGRIASAADPATGPDRARLPADVRALLEIFLPLQLQERWVVGQLGQSLDGRIATESGHSHYINGPEDIRRLHGLRALADAVVVGAGTAAADDPRLTARKLPGPDPVRVILDPRGRLPRELNVFSDAGPPTLWIQAGGGTGEAPPPGARRQGDAASGDNVTVVHLPVEAWDGGGSGGGGGRAGDGGSAGHDDGPGRPEFRPAAVVEFLRARGLHRILVEGGGRTVSAFLEAGLLDRLHICVAPLLIGSGRPGISLPAVPTLDEALRPRCRPVPLGSDVLFDLAFSRDG